MGLFDDFKRKAVFVGTNAGKAARTTGKNLGDKAIKTASAVKQNVQDDIQHRKETKQIQAEGERVLNKAQMRLSVSQQLLTDEIDTFEQTMQQLEQRQPQARALFLQYLQRKGISFAQQPKNMNVDTPQQFSSQQNNTHKTGTALSGLASGATTIGAMTAFGTASTGTAISSLSGGAYLTALLAALGGGSVATGGLGMIGGIAVLGATVTAPVLAIGAFSADKKIKQDYQKVLQWREEIVHYCDQVHDACYQNDLQRQKLRKLNQEIGSFRDLLETDRED